VSTFKGLVIFLIFIPAASFANTKVFVSFSMPAPLMIETLKDCERLHIPAYLNGLYENSMPKTINKIIELTKEVPNLSLQIDPFEFSKYEINQVPAIVKDSNNCFDVVYGNLPISDALNLIKDKGSCK